MASATDMGLNKQERFKPEAQNPPIDAKTQRPQKQAPKPAK